MIRNFTSVTKRYNMKKFDGYIILINNITSSVPLDPANTDYQDIQEWISKGGEVIDNPRSDNPPTE
jgi:glutathione peroxidase-family protein